MLAYSACAATLSTAVTRSSLTTPCAAATLAAACNSARPAPQRRACSATYRSFSSHTGAAATELNSGQSWVKPCSWPACSYTRMVVSPCSKRWRMKFCEVAV
ncbi:hypothetical protein D3C85_1630790 [compost metagenome]